MDFIYTHYFGDIHNTSLDEDGRSEPVLSLSEYLSARQEIENRDTEQNNNPNVTEQPQKRFQRKYTPEQIKAFFDDWTELIGFRVSELAQKHGITSSTAQRWIRDYKDSGKLPGALVKAINHGDNRRQEGSST